MLENAYVMVAIILVINIVYVSFSTIRMILTLKGRRYLAALLSMMEMVVYVVGLGLVLDNLDQIQNVIAYAVGFGIGVIVGTKIEEKLALGYITVNVISSDPNIEFTRKLRDKGYGVTSWFAYGMDGDRLAMQILTPRKYELKLYETIKNIDEKAFIISYEPKQIHGGFWVKQVRKGRLFNPKKKPSGTEIPPYAPSPGTLYPEADPTQPASYNQNNAVETHDEHDADPSDHGQKNHKNDD